MIPEDVRAAVAGQRRYWEVLEAALEVADLVAERAERMADVEVGHTPSEVVYAENTLEVHRYEPDERRFQTPVVVVYALVNRPYILDLQPDRSVVRRLLEAGFPVYLLDWGEPSRLDATLTLTDYVCRYMANAVRAALADADAADAHLLGYCMGGTMASAFAARDPEPVRSLTCMATPVAAEGTGGVLELWADHVDPAVPAETWSTVPGQALAVGFALLDPVENLLGKYLHLLDNLDDEAFVETFARMERWIWDDVDVAGAAFREFVDGIYRENRLVAGTFELAGEPVDLSTIDVPVQLLVGEDDAIVPPASSEPLLDAVAGDDTRLRECPVGHVGLSVSSAAHERLWPDVADWLADRSATATGRTGEVAGLTASAADRQDGDGDRGPDVVAAERTVASIARHGAVRLGLDGGSIVGSGESAALTSPVTPTADVETVAGIGPTYGTRLREAGIETVADLREREVSEVAAAADASRSRVADWLERIE